MLARRVCFVIAIVGLAITGPMMPFGCAHDARPRAAPSGHDWIDAPLTGSPIETQLAALEALEGTDIRAKVVRLDRLVDLADAARFAADRDARELLWEALGGHPTGAGPEATRTAFLTLLQQALALSEAPELSDAERQVLADLIALLSADLGRPTTADDLAAQMLAYRTLARQGHPRVADNARWRLYDHVRGTLAGAVEASTSHRRMEIATHALYANQDDITPWLADRPPHARPPWPTAVSLCELLERQRRAVAEIPRWTAVADARSESDEALRATVLATLPAARDPSWLLPTVSPGTGHPESLDPVIQASAEAITVDAGRPQSRTLAVGVDVPQLLEALQTALTAAGREKALLVAPPLLPSPIVTRILDAALGARLMRLELAVHEPSLTPQRDPPVVSALPLEIIAPDRVDLRTRVFQAARLRIHLEGMGARFAIDGQWLPGAATSTEELVRWLARLRSAYPRETVIILTTGEDVLYQQLVQLQVHVLGGEDPWMAVGLAPRGEPPKPGGSAVQDRLNRRVALAGPWPEARIEQPFPLQGPDQRQLEQLGASLADCLPELELARPLVSPLAVTVVFDEGAVVEVHGPTTWPRGLEESRRAETLACLEELAFGQRLARHRDRIEVLIRVGPAES